MTNAAVRPQFVARTRYLDDAADPLDTLAPGGFAWLHEGLELATAGVAARIPVGSVDATLAGFVVDDVVQARGTGAIAVGALPFAAPEAAELVIPAIVVGRGPDGRAWVTDIEAAPRMTTPAPLEPTTFTVRRGMPRAEWDAAVERLLGAIDAGDVRKVVLARDVSVEADRPFDITRLARRLRRAQPGCFVFAGDGVVGASPELLVARVADRVWARPLAGTTTRVDPAALTQLAASTKDTIEHQLVVDALVGGLTPWADGPVQVDGPVVARFGAIAHLASEISARVVGAPSALGLALAVHPTPAVGGTPAAAAAALIAELEPAGRGRYAGPVGWVDAAGNGEWALALRSAEIDGRRATLRAGAGIIAGSEPAAEWAETEAKLSPMLSVLLRP